MVYCAPAGHDAAVALRFDLGRIFAQIFELVSASVCVEAESRQRVSLIRYAVRCQLSEVVS